MIVYAASFLAFILVAVPYGFRQLGRWVCPDDVHAFLAPGPVQSGVGAVIAVSGFLAYAVSSLWLVIVGKGPFVEFDPPREFVATGPYRWMRNPVAAALLITVLGEGVYFGSAGILALFVIGLPLAQWQVVRVEEPRLRRRFGAAYDEYCRRVPRWRPARPDKDSVAPPAPRPGGKTAVERT